MSDKYRGARPITIFQICVCDQNAGKVSSVRLLQNGSCPTRASIRTVSQQLDTIVDYAGSTDNDLVTYLAALNSCIDRLCIG